MDLTLVHPRVPQEFRDTDEQTGLQGKRKGEERAYNLKGAWKDRQLLAGMRGQRCRNELGYCEGEWRLQRGVAEGNES